VHHFFICISTFQVIIQIGTGVTASLKGSRSLKNPTLLGLPRTCVKRDHLSERKNIQSQECFMVLFLSLACYLMVG
jgi:hypothetical protein